MESPCNGRKFFVCLFTLFILIGVVKNASAHGWPEIPGLQSLNLGGIRIVPEVQIGYENFSLNFNLPAATLQSPLPPFPSTLDLQLKDANLWIGSLSAAFYFPSALSFELIARANAKKDVNVQENEEYVFGGEQGVTWTGSPFERWMAEGRFNYRFSTVCSALVGLRRDHIAISLRDPRDSAGNPLNFDDSGTIFPGLTFERHQRYYSDLISKLWIPYIGLEVVGPGYKASLIGSPFAAAEFKVPAALLFDLTLTVNIPPFPPSSTQLIASDSLLYRVARPAVFLEGSFQYDLNLTSSLTVGLWCRASLMSLKGQGSWSHDSMAQVPPSPPNFDSQSQENPASYTIQTLGGGISAVLVL